LRTERVRTIILGVVVEFLRDEQAAGYGQFQGDLSQPEFERFFFLNEADRDFADRRRREHSRPKSAAQLGTFSSPDPLEVPWSVVDYLAGQPGITDSSVVKRYTDRAMTAYEHAWEIRRVYGYRDFADPDAQSALREFAETRAWTRPEGPRVRFDQAVAWLREQRIPLPGASAPARLVTDVRAAAADRLHAMVASATRRGGCRAAFATGRAADRSGRYERSSDGDHGAVTQR
jgi:Domain of unknown function (DUF4158)